MKLLLTGAFPYADDQRREISALCEHVYYIQEERIPLHEQRTDFDVAAIDVIVCNALFLHNDLDSFPRLQFVQLTSAGFDRVPLEAMQSRGIRVDNAKGVYSIPMAEWAVLKILEVYKQSGFFCRAQQLCQWAKNRDIRELSGKVAAIIGLGAVGTEIAVRLKAFGCRVIGLDPFVQAEGLVDERHGPEAIDAVFQRADILVLALPLTRETRHLVDRRKLALMKDSAVLVNVSRGGLIDEGALIEELQRGRYSGVALDVFEEEPLPVSSPLWRIDRVLVTPHNSFVSENTQGRFFALLLRNLNGFLSQEIN